MCHQIAGKVAAPLSRTNEIVILSGEGSRVTGEVNRLLAELPVSVNALTGVDLTKVRTWPRPQEWMSLELSHSSTSKSLLCRLNTHHWLSHTHFQSEWQANKIFLLFVNYERLYFISLQEDKEETASLCLKAGSLFGIVFPFFLHVCFGGLEKPSSGTCSWTLCPVLHRCLCCRRWSANKAKLPFDESGLTLAPLVRQRISASSMTLVFFASNPFMQLSLTRNMWSQTRRFFLNVFKRFLIF